MASREAGPSTGTRRTRIVLSDSEDEDAGHASQVKRRRSDGTNGVNGRSRHDEEEQDSDSDLEELSSRDGDEGEENGSVNGEANGHDRNGEGRGIAFRPEYQRDADGYVAGSITRIKCRGFMTYDYVEFRPGPHLNMILGPNGTGKSTIAAAIAIGLGFSPKVMGRADDLYSYIKQGAELAELEIELKNVPGKRNHIIKRRINREDGKSEWFLNASQTNHKAVNELVQRMGVQANNLCSFLPQDKVAEFAKMAPVTVLKETMRAAGDPNLTNWHEELVKKGDRAREIEDKLEKDVQERDKLQGTVDRMEPEIQHFDARAEQEKERDILSALVLVAEQNKLRQEVAAIKKKRDELKVAKEMAVRRRAPLMNLQAKKVDLRDKKEANVKAADDKIKDVSRTFNQSKRRFDDAERDILGVDNELRTLREKLRRREERKEAERRKIREAQKILDTPRDNHDDELRSKNQRRKDIGNQLRTVQAEVSQLSAEYRDSEASLQRLDREINVKSKHLEQLSSVEAGREADAREHDGSINFLLDWLEQNPMKLEGKVHKPPMVSVNVIDSRYAWQVEAMTNLAQRRTFICESRRDYDTLVRLNGTPFPPRMARNGRQLPAGKVRLNLALVDVTDQAVNPRRPCSPEQLARLKFDGFAIDFVKAEPGVIAFLNEKARLHQSALTLRSSSEIDPNRTLEAGINNWCTRNDINRAVRSNYGKRDAQITSQGPMEARAFAKAIDHSAVKRVSDEVAEMKRQMREAEKPHQDRRTKIDRAREKQKQLDHENRGIESEVRELKEHMARFSRAQYDLELAQKRLDALEAEISGEEQRNNLRAQKFSKVKKLLAPVRDFADAEDDALDFVNSAVVSRLELLQAQVDLDDIDDKLNEGDESIQALKDERDSLKAPFDEATNRAKQADARARDVIIALPIALRRAVDERKSSIGSPDQIQAELQSVINELDLYAGVDQSFVTRYKSYKRQLTHKIEEVTRREKDLGIIKKQIDRILSKFNPALDSLVQVVSNKFSAAFERVGCSGEVRVDRKPGDFAAWGIEILVSYRDNDSLQLLTGSLQSGGERSLATVTYLMSLSEMARTPFSLVDEINQGMDQRAERNVHNQLVKVTCSSDAGQYFLITPKLLTGLEYHPKMKVLIINNGPWLPDPTDKTQVFGDFASCLKRYAISVGE